MKTLVSLSTTSATGYELRIIRDDGSIDVLPIDKKVPDKETHGSFDWYILPENPANRKMISGKVIKDGMELAYRESKTFGPRDPNTTPKAPTKGWVEYLTDEEKALYEQLKAKAESRAKVAALKAQIAADQARLAELEAQA